MMKLTDSDLFSLQYRHLVEMHADLCVCVINMRRFVKTT